MNFIRSPVVKEDELAYDCFTFSLIAKILCVPGHGTNLVKIFKPHTIQLKAFSERMISIKHPVRQKAFNRDSAYLAAHFPN